MADQPLNIVLLGRSGCGKGTQAQLLVKEFDLEYIGTGDLLREYVKRDSSLAVRLKETLRQGHLVPSWMAFFVWMEKLAYTDSSKGTIFDGSPRKLWEAKMLDEALEWFGRTNVNVILVDVSRELAEKRLLARRVCSRCGKGAYVEQTAGEVKHCQHCGGDLVVRLEDNPEAIKERLDWFDEEVSQSIEHYKQKGGLIVVDGSKTPFEVHQEILAKLK